MRRDLAVAVLVTIGCVQTVAAQSGYRDTDSGRPVRVEDAEPVERGSLEFQFAPFRVERFMPNILRYQFEPRVTYGVAPRTEIELRAPWVYREPTAQPRGGLAGLGVGFLRNFNDETPASPSFALSGEYVIPAGGATTRPGTWVLRGASTRTFELGRIHLNVAYGTYNVVVYPDIAGSPGCVTNCGGVVFPPISDGPCELEPDDGVVGGAGAPAATATAVTAPQFQFRAPPDLIAKLSRVRQGRRLLVGAAADHAIPLWSTLFVADLFVERFSLSTQPADWSAEIGARHQTSPRIVIDAGLGRRFTGTSPSWFATSGTSYTMSTGGAPHGTAP